MADEVVVRKVLAPSGQIAYQFPSGRIVTVEAWESITDEARAVILAAEGQ